jgi:hypothetical protein
MAEGVVDVRDTMRSVTINVRLIGVRSMRVRMWLAAKLFALGAWVAGTGLELTL